MNVGKPTLDDFDIMSEFGGSPLDADIPELARFEQLADKKVRLTSLNIYWQSFKDEVMEKMKKFGLGHKPRKFYCQRTLKTWHFRKSNETKLQEETI